MKLSTVSRTALSCALVTAISAATQTAYATGLTIGQTPLFLTEGVAPNLFVTLDDSGSMERAYAPDGIKNTNGRRYKSAHYNPLYYNPNATYSLPKKVTYDSSTGQITLSEYSTSYSQAYINGFRTNRGKVDLSSDYRPTYTYVTTNTSQSFVSNPSQEFTNYYRNRGVPAYYYVFDTTQRDCTSVTDDQLEDDNCYRKVDVSTNEQQNFANWYSFYRTRALATQSAANIAFLSLPENVRVTWQMLNSCYLAGNGTCTGGSDTRYSNLLRNFSGAHRQQFFDWLADTRVSGSTPLKAATQRVGNFLNTTGRESPWAHTPGTTIEPQYSCRPSYHILMTDGVWNESTNLNIGNSDGTQRTLPDNTTYNPRAPYQDSYGSTLADLAFKLWAEDANSNLTNDQKPFIPYANANADTQYWDPRNDPATWQHLVTFTLGLGLTRSLTDPSWGGSTYTGGYSRLLDGSINWPQPGSNQAQNVYELWHAALNSRGEFFSVDSPDAMVEAFKAILSRIANRETSASAVSLESAVTSAGNEAYYARFSSDNWSGELLKYDVDSNGALTLGWNARDILATQGTTRAIKYNRNGVLADFTWANLNTTQRALLNKTATGVTDSLGSSRVDFIRGSRALEGTTFRERNYVLGDIIHSSPVVVGAPDRLAYMMDQAANPSGDTNYSTYADFRNTNSTRAKRIYVGANDGMLHAFDESGREVFAYIPTSIISKLNLLSDKGYKNAHQYYVDGTPVVSDVYDETARRWKTILIGTLRGGGRSVFALDITNPSTPSLLWEFSSTNDQDLGFTFPEPVITKLHNGKWGVLVANGYNSTDDKAALFVINALDGTVIRKLEVGQAGTVNGLSTPKAVDINGDLVTDYVYAGDLQGNVWRFDLFDSSVTPRFRNTGTVNANTFKVAFNGNPLYIATASDGTTRQAITSAPTLLRHPTGTGYIVSFGTGKYIETADAQANTSVAQTLYGVWDRQTAGQNASSTPSLSRSNLVQQTMGGAQTDTFSETDNSAARSREFRLISRNNIQWIANDGTVNKYGWYLDLQEGTTRKGELVATAMTTRANVLIAATTTPNADPCSSGIDRWFIAIDGYTGGATQFNVLDMTGNNYVTASDGYNGAVVSSIRIPGFGSPAIVGTDAFLNTDTGIQKEVLDFGPTSRGRQTWRVMGE